MSRKKFLPKKLGVPTDSCNQQGFRVRIFLMHNLLYHTPSTVKQQILGFPYTADGLLHKEF